MPLVTCPPSRRPAPRRGSALVEAAFVLPIFLTFVFGVYEYGRYLLVLNVTTNAARDGARWAAVHANDQRTADSTVPGLPTANYRTFSPVTDARLTGTFSPRRYRDAPYGPGRPVYNVPFVDDYVRVRSGPVANMLTNRSVWVFAADTPELYAGTVRVLPKMPEAGVTHSWRKASFTERIAVQIVGDYQPILPSLLFKYGPDWDTGVIPVSVIGLAPSEG